MLEREEQIAKFAAAINEDAAKCRREIEAEFESVAATALEKVRGEQEAYAKREIKLETARLTDASNRKLSRLAAERRAALTEKRGEITKEVFMKAKEKLLTFTETPEYDEFLKSVVTEFSKTFTDGNVTIFVKPEDLSKADIIKTSFGRECTVSEDKKIKIGGCCALNEEGTLLLNDTLDERLSSCHEWFLETCGMSVIL